MSKYTYFIKLRKYMVAEEISIRSDIGGDNVEGVGYLLGLRAPVDTVRRSCHVTVAQK
jgi:hypothetical protein